MVVRQMVLDLACELSEVAVVVNQMAGALEIVSVSHALLPAGRVHVVIVLRGEIEDVLRREAELQAIRDEAGS